MACTSTLPFSIKTNGACVKALDTGPGLMRIVSVPDAATLVDRA